MHPGCFQVVIFHILDRMLLGLWGELVVWANRYFDRFSCQGCHHMVVVMFSKSTNLPFRLISLCTSASLFLDKACSAVSHWAQSCPEKIIAGDESLSHHFSLNFSEEESFIPAFSILLSLTFNTVSQQFMK